MSEALFDHGGLRFWSEDEIELREMFVQRTASLLKLNRWLGYIQGSLIQWEITTVQDERDWTRPLFRPLDFKE